jgi:predicted nuclease of predicted toxin-antitoxin system
VNLIVDMNLSPRWISVLADAGFTAVHWSSVGAANAPDSEIMRYARQHKQIVLTHDLDYSSILAATQGEKPSVVKIRAAEISPRTIGPQSSRHYDYRQLNSNWAHC